MFKNISKIFVAGLLTVFPILVTGYLLYWFFSTVESILGGGMRLLLSDRFYSPGMGVAAGIITVFLVGIMMKTWIAQTLFRGVEFFVHHIPVVKSIYSTLRDFADFLSKADDGSQGFDRMVMVPLGDTGLEVMGFVTQNDFTGIASSGIGKKDSVAVYVPMSFQIGGFTVIQDRSKLRAVDMPIKSGFRFVMTAGVTKSEITGAT